MTVSRAFRQDASVGKETREKVLRIAESMGYVFDSTASTLRSQRTNFVAVTIPSLNNANFADMVRGLNDSLSQQGLQILMGYTNYSVDEEEQLIEQLLRATARGHRRNRWAPHRPGPPAVGKCCHPGDRDLGHPRRSHWPCRWLF